MNQINIKINQTDLGAGGKIDKPVEGGVSTFNQILEALHLHAPLSPTVEQTGDSSQVNTQTSNGDTETDIEEELLQLELVLAELAAYIEQNPIFSMTLPNDKTQSSVNINQLVNEVEQWIQKAEQGPKNLVQTQLIEDLKHLLEDLTFSKNTILIELAIEQIRQNIQSAIEKGKEDRLLVESRQNGDLKQTVNSAIEPENELAIETLEDFSPASKLLTEGVLYQNKGASTAFSQEALQAVSSGVQISPRPETAAGARPAIPVLQIHEVGEWAGGFIKFSTNQAGSTQARISLYPEHLGPVEIKIISNEGQLSAQLITETLSAKDALEGQLQQLKQTLQQYGLQVQRLDIILQTQSSNEFFQSNLSFMSGGSGSSQEQRRPNQKEVTHMNADKKKDEEGPAVAYAQSPRKSWSSIDFTA